jgi:glucose/arabinose dehydrogenase
MTCRSLCDDRFRWRRWIALLAVAMLHFTAPAAARVSDRDRSEEAAYLDYDPVRLAGPFEFPWSLAFLPDNTMLVTERPGRLLLVRPGSAPREIVGLPPIQTAGLGGLLDVAIDPAFARNHTIFFSYTHGQPEASTLRVVRARLDLAEARLTDRRVIFETDAQARTEQHGGRLAVTRNGYLFLSVGDRWQLALPQDLGSHNGKIVRIRTDGTVPADNPFAGVQGALPEIWSYGHRNPQGLAYDEETGRLWSHEHGPMGGDEINLIERGRNYGWPVITHGLGYDGKPVGIGSAREGMEQPLHPIREAIAPSGLAVENAGQVTILWLGALAGQSLFRFEIENGRVTRETRLLREEFGRIRDVRIGPDGLLYLLTDDAEGALYRLDPLQDQAREGRNRGRL